MLVEHNCAENKAFANRAGVPLAGCANLGFSLATKDYIGDVSSQISKVKDLMTRISTPSMLERLRPVTHLRPKGCNEIRWRSTLDMIDRYLKIRDHLIKIEGRQRRCSHAQCFGTPKTG